MSDEIKVYPGFGDQIIKPLDKNFGASVIADLTDLRTQVVNLEKERATDTSQTKETITKQMNENTNLRKQFNKLTEDVVTLANTPNITDPDKAQLAIFRNQLKELGTQIARLFEGTSLLMATYILENTDPRDTPYNNASNPALASPLNSESTPIVEDGPNLFLATSLMALMFQVELSLVQQSIQNMDVERGIKVEALKNYMTFAKLSAIATFNKDMDQAAIYMNQAITSFIGAGLSLGMGIFAMAASGKMMKENAENRALLKDNPAFKTALDEKYPTARTEADQFLPSLGKDGKPMPQAGVKQIQEEIDAANESKTKEANGTTITEQKNAINAKWDRKIQQMTEERDRRAEQYQNTNPNMMNNPSAQARINFLSQTAPQVINQTVQGIQASINSGIQIQLANDDASAVIASAAMSIAQQYLQSAMDAFKSEQQNIQAVIEFLMSIASKNTQWSSIRA